MSLNIKSTLDHMGISSTCYSQAVQEVAQKLERNTIAEAVMFVHQVIGVHTTFEDADEAVMVSQAIVETAIKHNGDVGFDPEEALAAAKKRYRTLRDDPARKWMFAKPEGYSAPSITETREMIAGIETTVQMTAEGKFKKGQKEELAKTLYEDFQKNHPDAAHEKKANQAFIAILMDKLGMTKAGATTYNYNMKKKLGGTITPKPKRAK